LPPGGGELLLLAASSTTQAVAPILRATAELGIDDDVLEAVERQGLVAMVDGNLRLRHPVLRSVVRQRSTPAARRAAHQALADVLDAGTDEDRERRAWHLAAAAPGPSSDTADLLEDRSEEHTSELQSLMRISYAVFCLKKKNQPTTLDSNT